MKKLLLICFALLSIHSQGQLRFTMVNPATSQATIKNFGAADADISTYRLCALFSYATLNMAPTSIVSGDLYLSPNEEVTVQWNLNATASDLGLYLPSGSFGSAAAMVAFVEWGGGMLGRESVAVSAGLWANNTFITGTGPFYYTGDGTQSGVGFWGTEPPAVDVASVVINEVDADQTGTDAGEFIEIIGEPGASLDGLVVVFFNGGATGDASYFSTDLTGQVIPTSGFFVLGNAAVPNVNLTFSDNTLQNGADAVAIYEGTAAAWPNGTLPTATGLVDAIVYATNDPVDQALIDILIPGGSLIDESANGSSINDAMARVPDGGTPLDVSTYVTQAPTPGATNFIPVLCDGAEINIGAATSAINICNDLDNLPVTVANNSTAAETYWYIVTDDLNNIILVSQVADIELDGLSTGDMRIWGISFTGTLDPATLTPGLPASGIAGDACLDLSDNFIDVIQQVCNPASCDGGEVTTVDGTTVLDICLDDVTDMVNIITSSISDSNYEYALTDANGGFIQWIPSDIDLNSLTTGTYRIYGVSYYGTVDPTTTDAGDLITNLTTDGDCIVISSNFIEITAATCVPIICEGGTIGSSAAYNTFCIDGNPDVLSFATTSGAPVSYTYVVTDNNNIIVALVENASFDFDALAAGSYRVWGLSYEGSIDPTTVEAGDDATLVASSGSCVQLSSNYIEVVTTICTINESCSELFFSEYVEGPSFQKALEIYNPTQFPVDLSEYSVRNFSNGATAFTSIIQPIGTLAPGGVFIITNTNASTDLLAIADTTSSVALFNGDDAIQLVHNEDVIDQIGEIGVDPGTEWTFGTNGSTLDQTLIRMPNINVGTSNWTFSTSQWIVNASGDISNLGVHNFIACPATPFIGFAETSYSGNEGESVSITIESFDLPEASTIMLTVSNATATSEDYTSNMIIDLPAGTSTTTWAVDITDDIIEEGVEFVTFAIDQVPAGTELLNAATTLTIGASDLTYDVYDIAEVTVANAEGIMDSINVYCELRGVVYGINWNASGVHFHLVDDTDGIKVFAATENFGYTVQEGDLISVQGQIAQFRGQAEIRPDNITVLNTGSAITSMPVDQFNEGMESHAVSISCVELIDPSQWTNAAEGFYVDVTNGINTFRLRIDGDTDLEDNTPLLGKFTAFGLIEQEDDTAPYEENYVLWLRGTTDVTDQVYADFNDFTEITYGDNGASINFLNTSLGNVNNSWSFGDGETSNVVSPVHIYSYDFMNANQVFDISLTVSNDLGCSHTTTITVDAVYSSVVELDGVTWNVYPNPTIDFVQLQSSSVIENIVITDASGRLVARENKVMAKNTRLDLSGMSAGLYFISIETAQGVATKLIEKK
ncbi:MAG: lamin tail domain-containing protein [Flavobacteriales bacterium]